MYDGDEKVTYLRKRKSWKKYVFYKIEQVCKVRKITKLSGCYMKGKNRIDYS